MIRQSIAQFRSDGLRGRALRGSALTFFQFGASNALRLASNLVLTRLLFPEIFGLMAIVMVIMTGLQMFSDMGFRLAIIQNKRGDDPVFLNTAWTMQIARGVLLWLAACALAQPLAYFYQQPMLMQILPVMAFAAVISGFDSTRLATANRNMMLGRLTTVHLGVQALSILVMITLAYVMESIWAIVVGNLVGALATSILSHLYLPGQPNRIQFEFAAAKGLFHFGKYIFIATIAGFLASQGDRAILGKFVSLSDLAVYNIAFFLASVPLMLSSTVVDRIVFPLYTNRPPSASSDNRRKLAEARFLVTAILFALAATLSITGDWLIRLLYDSRYHEAGPILVLLSMSFLFMLITASYTGLPLAAGHSGRFALLISISAAIRTGLFLYFVPTYGIIGAVFVPMIAELLFYPILISLVRRYGGWDPRHDAVFAVLAATVALITVWVNLPALENVFGLV
jgi:O-antigen/teichoic acid export membrane protein